AARPPRWFHDVRLDAALARAKRESKPLLVDFEADWCSWCKRLDYYVYPDAEVAALLDRFVLLKINEEFDYDGLLARLGGKALPYLVILDARGRPFAFPHRDEQGRTTTITGPPGFQPPAAFARVLREALETWPTR
ncbi:MAG: thioredoxin family protein, partial [Planctomycetota bacterium]